MTAELVEIVVEIEATPEVVFEYFTETVKVMEWHGAEAECDATPGGVFMLNVVVVNVVRGHFVEVDPPRRVVFTWGHEGEEEPFPAGSSTVEVTLTPTNAGTRLQIRHRDLPDEEHAEHHRVGWTHYMERLAHAAEGRHPGADEWRRAAGSAPGGLFFGEDT